VEEAGVVGGLPAPPPPCDDDGLSLADWVLRDEGLVIGIGPVVVLEGRFGRSNSDDEVRL